MFFAAVVVVFVAFITIVNVIIIIVVIVIIHSRENKNDFWKNKPSKLVGMLLLLLLL